MKSFLRRVCDGANDSESHRYFIRFGKGNYGRRFLINLDKNKKIKIRTSFELANDLVKLVDSLKKESKYSGKILMKDKVPGLEARKKAGVFVYEVSEKSISEFQNAYYYLLDVNNEEILLKIKKSLPKPGKDEGKIDERFCALDLDLKYWPEVKEFLFWDVPECKKVSIEHNVVISEIELPKGEKDPVKIRENALRVGKMVRTMEVDGKKVVKEYSIKA
jgi:hypothetical protein